MTAFVDTVNAIIDQIEVLKAKLHNNEVALKALQDVCFHDWEEDHVSGHNGDVYYVCTKCRCGPTKFPQGFC